MKWAANRVAPRVVVPVIVVVLLSVAPGVRAHAQVNWSPVADGLPRTAAELNDFAIHTGHAQMWAYLEALHDAKLVLADREAVETVDAVLACGRLPRRVQETREPRLPRSYDSGW